MDAEAVTDEHGRSGRPNRVVPIPRRWDQACKVFGPGGRRWLESPARRGEHVYAVNQSRREGWVAPVEPVVIFFAFHGCNQHPVFPAPSRWEGWIFHQARTPCAARRLLMRNTVIASQRVRAKRGPMTGSAKQSRAPCEAVDCFVAIAPRNDEASRRPRPLDGHLVGDGILPLLGPGTPPSSSCAVANKLHTPGQPAASGV
jgi:hypothetical protein